MGTTLLIPGTLGFDCAGIPDYQAAYDSGKRFVSMYLGNKFGVAPWQVRAAHDAGLVVIWNREGSPSLALGGYNVGVREAEEATNIAASFGWNGETGIIYSGTDTGITPDEFGICDDFYRGTWDGGGNNLHGDGAYGPALYLRHLWVQSWLPPSWVLWHWAGDHAIPEHWTTVQQLLKQEFYATTVDLDRIELPVKGWTGPTPDPPERTDMPEYRYTPEGYVAELFMGYKRWVTGDYFYGVIQAQLSGSGVVSPLGIYAQPCSLDLLNATPDYPAGGGTGPTNIALQIPSVPGQATGTLS